MNAMTVVRFEIVAHDGKFRVGGLCYAHEMFDKVRSSMALKGFQRVSFSHYEGDEDPHTNVEDSR